MRGERQVEDEEEKLPGFGNKGEEAIYLLAISRRPGDFRVYLALKNQLTGTHWAAAPRAMF